MGSSKTNTFLLKYPSYKLKMTVLRVNELYGTDGIFWDRKINSFCRTLFQVVAKMFQVITINVFKRKTLQVSLWQCDM